MQRGSGEFQKLEQRLASLDVELESLNALPARSYGEARSRRAQKRAVQDSIEAIHQRIAGLSPWVRQRPSWGDGTASCAGCGTTTGLYRPGLIRWSQPRQ